MKIADKKPGQGISVLVDMRWCNGVVAVVSLD